MSWLVLPNGILPFNDPREKFGVNRAKNHHSPKEKAADQ